MENTKSKELITQAQIEKELDEAEKIIRDLLDRIKKDYTENKERLEKAKETLKLNLQEYKYTLAKEIDLSVAIAEQEVVLEELMKKRNPSKRYEKGWASRIHPKEKRRNTRD